MSFRYNKNPCLDCEGQGRNVQRRSVAIRVPAGVNDQETVQMNDGKVNAAQESVATA